MDVMKESTQQEILAELQAQGALVHIIAKGYDIESPAALQELCASGQIQKFFNIGDVIYIPWTDNSGSTPVEYSFPFVVVHIADVYDDQDVLHKNGLWLMALYTEPWDIVFDAAETTEVDLSTETHALEGWYYFGVSGTTYSKLDLETGEAIPTTYDSVKKCGINDTNVLRYGYNRWSHSAYRQWLNSDVEKNVGWWTSQHLGDVAPGSTDLNKPGWLNGFTSEWKAIFKPVKIHTCCNTVTDGGVTDVTYDTFFLPSREQMYGTPNVEAGAEDGYWEYWKNATGYSQPTDGFSSAPNDARKITSIANPTGAAVDVRLRSACRSSSYGVWYVTTGGYLYNFNNANNHYRSQPACVIY